MNAAIKTSREDSQYRWNAGSWFGGAIGSTAWMVITACFLVGFGQTGLAVVPVVCFVVTISAAIVIWCCRARLSFISGMMSLIGILAFTIPIAWLTTSVFASDDALASMNWPASSLVTAFVLFAAPVVGLWVVFVESQRQPKPRHQHGSSQDAR